MTDSSNTEVDSQVAAGTESETTSNSNGNFSGGFDSSALSNESFSTDSTPDFGIDFGSNNNSGSFDFGYNPFDDSSFDFVDGLSRDSGSSKTSKSDNKSEPVMTVDEVYGKGNQSIVESQGDYAASSNEKSNVETSTFGKQDEISVTPTSVTEDKGLVNNDAIQSVEGLDFQQKDKANQDVMEAKKSRDEAEAEDKTNQMKDSLLSNIGRPIGKQGEGDVSKFQLGNRDEDLAAVQKELEQATKVKNDATTKAQESDKALKVAEGNVSKQEALHEETKSSAEAVKRVIGNLVSETKSMVDGKDSTEKAVIERSPQFNQYKALVSVLAENYGIDIGDISKAKSDDLVNAVNVVAEGANKKLDNDLKESEENVAKVKQYRDEIAKRNAELWSKANKADESFKALKTKYNDIIKSKFEEAPVTTTPKAAENTVSETKQTFENAIKNAVEKGADEQTVKAMNDIATSIDEAQTTMKDAIERNDIPAFIESQKQYNDLLEDALKIGNVFTQTDYNKPFVEAVAKANDFMATLADGTQVKYSEFATNMATKSPEVAKAMYEAKADRLEKENHPVLAKIERAKASMVGTWIGSKLTRADNQVRNQFNQMAKTDMRATYAAYNNVLKDPNATTEQKAEASAAINQANSLMTASAALQASTGFFSGIGDSMKDGVYGTTDPKTLNAYQKTLNAVDNLAKITLGLGVTPGANRAYQNMYYMAGAKVNESGLFSKDFDSDGFALCQEYGNNAAAGMIAGAGELATGVALFFNPSTAGMGANLVIDSVQTFINGLYGVQKDARKSEKYTQEVLSYFKEAESIAAETGNKEAVDSISNGITQIENFQLKSDEVGNLDNWLEGSGSNTADNGKFNQALTYDEWLKLIKADPVMQEYAKSLNR